MQNLRYCPICTQAQLAKFNLEGEQSSQSKEDIKKLEERISSLQLKND